MQLGDSAICSFLLVHDEPRLRFLNHRFPPQKQGVAKSTASARMFQGLLLAAITAARPRDLALKAAQCLCLWLPAVMDGLFGVGSQLAAQR